MRIHLDIGENLTALIRELVGSCRATDDRNTLAEILRLVKEIKDMNAETVRLLNEIDAASTELASDIQVLIDKANEAGSVSAAEVNAALAPKVEFLKKLAADTNSPVPSVPETPPTEG